VKSTPPAVVLTGDRSILHTAHQGLVALCAKGADRLTVLDCNGNLNPYLLAQIARRAHIDAKAVLARVWVCRAFTGYQQINALRRTIGMPASQRFYVLNPLELLLDPDLPPPDRPWLLNRLFAGLTYLAEHGHQVRVWVPEAEPTDTEYQAFHRALTERFPTMTARDGQLLKVQDGQERPALLPRHRRSPSGVPRIPSRVA